MSVHRAEPEKILMFFCLMSMFNILVTDLAQVFTWVSTQIYLLRLVAPLFFILVGA